MRKTIIKFSLGLLTCLTSLTSCSDIFEEDISKDIPKNLSPVNNSSLIGNSIQFQWSHINGADSYRLQILNHENIIVDTLFQNYILNYSLNEGNYQWRIRGENFAYKTLYSEKTNFKITDSKNLNDSKLITLAPSNNIYTNSKKNSFSWESIPNVEYYTIQIIKNIDGELSIVEPSKEINATFYTPDESIFDDDANYQWTLQAFNDTSSTNAVKNNIFIDTTVPPTPTSIAPSTSFEEKINTSINFSWNKGTDTGNVKSPTVSTLQISTSPDFKSLYNVFENIEPLQYSEDFSEPGTYYWRVLIKDKAGNESDSGSSEIRNFIIN